MDNQRVVRPAYTHSFAKTPLIAAQAPEETARTIHTGCRLSADVNREESELVMSGAELDLSADDDDDDRVVCV